jgi:hypothetical protein
MAGRLSVDADVDVGRGDSSLEVVELDLVFGCMYFEQELALKVIRVISAVAQAPFLDVALVLVVLILLPNVDLVLCLVLTFVLKNLPLRNVRSELVWDVSVLVLVTGDKEEMVVLLDLRELVAGMIGYVVLPACLVALAKALAVVWLSESRSLGFLSANADECPMGLR